MPNVVFYDPASDANVEAFDYLAFQQLPTTPTYADDFASILDDLFGFGLAVTFYNSNTHTPSTTYGNLYTDVPEFSVVDVLNEGSTVDTDGTIFDGMTGYDPVAYAGSDGNDLLETGETFTADKYTGYGGYATHTINLDLDTILTDLTNFDPNDIVLEPVADTPVVLDDSTGFNLTFEAAILDEEGKFDDGGGTDAFGFSVLIVTENGDAIELGWQSNGSDPDTISAYDADFGLSQSVEVDDISQSIEYDLNIIDGQYYLTSEGVLLLTGDLINYNFDPANSDPPFPNDVNPYETASFIFLGDDTDRAFSEFTLGPIELLELNSGSQSGSGTFTGGDRSDFYTGDASGEVILGNGGADFLDGEAGDDNINGKTGDDVLSGGDGNDILGGGDGNDTLEGDADDDILNGKSGDDTLIGGDGSDTLDGGDGNDTLKGKQGIDTLLGGDGDDVLGGGQDNDTLGGKVGRDQLSGGAGDDILGGGKGQDILNGADGNDTLVGGFKSDMLTGGDGIDTFRYSSLDHSLLINGANTTLIFDIITDLVIGTDVIDGVNTVSAASLQEEAGTVTTLDETGIQAVLTAGSFAANGAATFAFGSREFLALNDGTAGFQASSDAIIEITGFSGDLANLEIA
ncbi:MAG: calcium-binding protein [Cyanobacteria bacterium P01_F01_bin.86]